LYKDGATVGTPLTNRQGPIYPSNSRITFGNADVGSAAGNPLLGHSANWLVTETLLSADQVSAYHSACVATLTGGAGGTLTFTRASAATCAAEDGTITTLPTGRACVTRGGLQIEAAATNLVKYPRDLSQVANWTLTNATCPRTASGKDSALNSASTCTSSSGNATVLQTLSVAAATRTTSLDIKRRTGTGNIDGTRDGAAYTTFDATNCFNALGVGTAPNAVTWVRCQLTGSVLNPTVGIRIVTSGDAVDVDWVQDEVGAFPTSRCDGGSSTCTRAAVTATLARPTTHGTEGCLSFRAYMTATPTYPQALVSLTSTTALHATYGSATTAAIFAGPNSVSATTSSVLNRWVPVQACWSAQSSTMHIFVDGIKSSNTTYNAGTVATTVTMGGNVFGTVFTGYLADVVLTGSHPLPAAVSVSDDFNRANGALGANWTTLTGTNAPAIQSNTWDAAGTQPSASYWSANTFSANQSAEISFTDFSVGPSVRMAGAAQTAYYAYAEDDGLESGTFIFRLYKVVAGTPTLLGSSATGQTEQVLKLTASGTTITLYSLASHGGAANSRIAVVDSAIATGQAGIYAVAPGVNTDSWYGADL